jgi:hypothetical protein
VREHGREFVEEGLAGGGVRGRLQRERVHGVRVEAAHEKIAGETPAGAGPRRLGQLERFALARAHLRGVDDAGGFVGVGGIHGRAA